MIDLVFRHMVDHDRNFVLSSWLRSFATSDEVWRLYGTRVADYFVDYHPVVVQLIARSTVLVAALEEEPDAIVGWAALEGPALHYLLVKSSFRRTRHGAALLQALPGVEHYTHMTPMAASRLRLPEHWQYRPYRRYAT